MLLEAIDKIESLATAARAPIVTCAAEPGHVYYLRKSDGELERVEAWLPPATYRPADIDSLCRHAVAHAAREVWYSRGGIVAHGEAEDARDSARLELTPSPQLARLAEWDKAGRKSVTQSEFVLLLRTLFANCAPDSLLPTIRQVKTSKKNDIDAQQSQGKVSLTKQMVADMTGASAIPERVGFMVPVFAQAAVFVRAEVRVEIDPDPVNESFTLVVLPGDIETAQAGAETMLATRLASALGDSAIPIYRGQP